MRKILPHLFITEFTVTLVVFSLILVGGGTASLGKSPKKGEQQAELAKIYVLYSEPPFPYETTGEIRIRLLSIWDRDRMEREIREQTALNGGEIIILDRSFMELDPELRPVRKDPHAEITLKIPSRTAYVEGRIGIRTRETPARDCQRSYSANYDTVRTGVLDTIRTLGWDLETDDGDSRYLITRPVVTASVTMECTDQSSEWLPAVFSVFMNNYADTTSVRLDVAFVHRTTGSPTTCRSAGVYEKAFFRKLDETLGTVGAP